MAADLDELVALETASFAGDRLSRRSFRRLLIRPSAELVVAEAGRLLGYVLVVFRAGSRKARIYSLAVAARARGQGVGRALIEAAVGAAQRRGCERIGLEVREDNRRAQTLYRDLGFRDIGRRPDYYADGAPARVFVRELAP